MLGIENSTSFRKGKKKKKKKFLQNVIMVLPGKYSFQCSICILLLIFVLDSRIKFS